MNRRIVCLLALTTSVGLLSDRGFTQQPAARRDLHEVRIVAAGLRSAESVREVRDSLQEMRGVHSVDIDLATRTLAIGVEELTPVTLGTLWFTVEQAGGGPTVLRTWEATYRLTRPQSPRDVQQARRLGNNTIILIDNLHCAGCAQKIAGRIQEVAEGSRVQYNLAADTLTVQPQRSATLSPWNALEAVAAAAERPLTVQGNYGTLAIEWHTARVVSDPAHR